jgi:hypothetical protein
MRDAPLMNVSALASSKYQLEYPIKNEEGQDQHKETEEFNTDIDIEYDLKKFIQSPDYSVHAGKHGRYKLDNRADPLGGGAGCNFKGLNQAVIGKIKVDVYPGD